MKEQMRIFLRSDSNRSAAYRLHERGALCGERRPEEEWKKYVEQTMRHEQILREVMGTLGMDAEKETPGRKVVRHIGESLVQAMVMAREEGEPETAQIVAAECVVLAETKTTRTGSSSERSRRS